MAEPSERQDPFLSYARFRFHLRVTKLITLPPYKGGVFRGAFGNVLKKTVCLAPGTECPQCLISDRCLYVTIFNPTPRSDYAAALKFRQAPRPYILNPPLTPRKVFHPGDSIIFELVLVGAAIEALPHFLYIFKELGRKGLGAEKGKYELMKVDLLKHFEVTTVFDAKINQLFSFAPDHGPITHPDEEQVQTITLYFSTPLRLKSKGHLVTRLSFPLFFEHLAHRLFLLGAFYGNEASMPDFHTLSLRSETVIVQRHDLLWYDWHRYSRRQEAKMNFGGLRGAITFSGPLGPFMPFLRLGEIVHVGQATTFGLGQYHLQG